MEKIISINLAGQVLPIEESAYEQLKNYFESLRAYFATQEGGDEILSDIESRVAELLVAKIRLGAPAINTLHISEVQSQLGGVEDFREADGAETGPENATPEGSPPPRARRRFFRDPNDKVLGGVCSGLAGYFNVDPALVRIIFGVLALAGWGSGILLYIALWFIVPESPENTYQEQRLYRSAEDKWIGGVCGGLAAYFDKDPWIFRLAFGIPLLFGTGLLDGFSFVFGSLSGAALLIYILLWIVLPLAKTDFQKMELRGEKIDLNTIRDNVYSDFKTRSKSFAQETRQAADRLSSDFKTRSKSFAQETRQAADRWSAEAKTAFGPAARTGASALGRILRAIFLTVAAFVAFLLFFLLIGYFFSDLSKMANLYLFQSPRQKTLSFLTVILLLGMPLLSVLTAILRSTLHLPASIRYARLAFNMLWICGFVTLGFLISSLTKSVKQEATVRQTMAVPVEDSGTLLVQAIGEPIRYRNNIAGLNGSFKGLDLDEDSLRSAWMDFRITPSTDGQYRAVVIRSSRGRSKAEAQQRAQNIHYPVSNAVQVMGMLRLPSGFAIAQPDYYRGQQVGIELQIPVGRKVQFDGSMANTILDDYMTETSYGYSRNRKRWQYRRRWQAAPRADVIYVMGTDGKLHRADGLEDAYETDENEREDFWEDEAEPVSGHVI